VMMWPFMFFMQNAMQKRILLFDQVQIKARCQNVPTSWLEIMAGKLALDFAS
jgi:hypothetical protein